MSLEYYLLSKKKYDSIIRNLKEVIENYEDILTYNDKLDIDSKTEILNSKIEILNSKTEILDSKTEILDSTTENLNYIIKLRNICNQKIIKLCNHEFVKDTIDINPEKSQNINYCKICEYTLPN